jgi:LysM repeat protein
MYYFFLGVVPLPITPGAIEITSPSGNVTKHLINHGEINIPRLPGLQEISFECLLPRQKYHFSNYSLGDYTASTLIPLLKLWKETREPFQFIITRMSPDNQVLDFTSIKVLLEDYTLREDAEELGTDVMCSIVLKEYKDYPTVSTILQKVLDTAKDAAYGAGATGLVATVTKTRSTTGKTTQKTYTVVKGDTLWSICKKYLGDGQKYKEVAKLNNISNPDLIYPGQKLRLS